VSSTSQGLTTWQYWTTFVGVTVALGVGSLGYTQMYARVSAIEDRQHVVLERLAALDVQVASLNQADDQARRDRDQITQKLDQVLLNLSQHMKR
jgi:hypothetical protein